jgi:hypothetical protein
VRQELQHLWRHVVAQAVHLQPPLVVYVHVLLLSGCKEELVVQEGDVTRRLLDLQDTAKRGWQRWLSSSVRLATGASCEHEDSQADHAVAVTSRVCISAAHKYTW